MELSSKITRSVYLFLEKQGEIAGEVLQTADLSPDAALDPERWLQASQVELFLGYAQSLSPDFSPKKVAREAQQFRAWGLLDQVLRIIQSSVEIYQQPHKFLSYFIRPEVPAEWVEQTSHRSHFIVPISSEEFPLVTDFLVGALEAVSLFSGDELAEVQWNKHSISIDWAKDQESFFDQKEPLNPRPQIYEEVVKLAEKQQSELSELKEKLAVPSSDKIIDDLKILQDYFLRSRQLVSLLKAQNGNQKWFKEAMKRLNWDDLQGLFQERVGSIEARLKGEEVASFDLMSSSKEDSKEQQNLTLFN